MSLQVFLQAQLLGSEEFLAAPLSESQSATDEFIGKTAWLTLYCEVLPRALLAEFKLSRMLLGSSSAEQFLLVLGEEDIPHANQFLSAAAAAVSVLSDNTLRLVWASTENLGAWQVVRERLEDALTAAMANPLDGVSTSEWFSALPRQSSATATSGYFAELGRKIISASAVGWSKENPAYVSPDGGDFRWPITDEPKAEDDQIFFPKRFAMNEEGIAACTVPELAGRAEGIAHWGILRGDVDHFHARLRRTTSIEEHIHLSMLFKQFFAGELGLLCTYPEFWRKVSLLHRGGDDFVVVGAWDALITLAREVHRLFDKFVGQNLQSVAGVEGKTISMTVAIAPDVEAKLPAVFERAGLELRSTKVTEAGTLFLFGRTLDWARMKDAEELKASLVALADDFGAGADYIHDLASVYRESFSARMGRPGKAVKLEKPWRTYMRVSRVLPQARNKEFLNQRNTIITHLLGKRTVGMKLRPSARVGLEWARLAAGD